MNIENPRLQPIELKQSQIQKTRQIQRIAISNLHTYSNNFSSTNLELYKLTVNLHTTLMTAKLFEHFLLHYWI